MSSTKYEGSSYPAHFLKSRGSVIMNNFLENRTKQAIRFAPRNDVYALFATNKTKPIINMHVSYSCSDTFYIKSLQFSFVFLQIFCLKFQPVYKPYLF